MLDHSTYSVVILWQYQELTSECVQCLSCMSPQASAHCIDLGNLGLVHCSVHCTDTHYPLLLNCTNKPYLKCNVKKQTAPQVTS